MKTRYQSAKIPATRKWLCAFLAAVALLRQHRLLANPTGLTVGAGHATAQQLGSQLNITVSQAALLNWQSFNIAPGETTSFLQPSANSVVLNVIGSASPSQIFGGLKANGTVILENASGFYFGPDSLVKVGGSLLATTAPVPLDFGSAAGWQFTGLPPLASIVNYGQIQVGAGKSLFLIAENIQNHGSLVAPEGNVELAAGQSVLVSDSPDGRGLSAKVTLPQGSVNNLGQIIADGGSIMMEANVVNQGGLLQADSIQFKNGVVELVASDQLNLGAGSQILARGDDSASGSAGGTVTLKSDNIFSDAVGSQIVTTGGANGGNGGNVEVSAPNIESLNSAMDAGAQSGFLGGVFSLDPANIVLGTSGSGTVPANGTVGYGSSGNLLLNVNTAFENKNFSEILLQATGNIYVGNGSFNSSGLFTFTANPGITWNLSASTGESGGQLALEAGGSIYFGNRSLITDANNWSVTLEAGYDFVNGTVPSGSGSIYLGDVVRNANGVQSTDANGNYIPSTGNGAIQLAFGNVSLLAAGSVDVGAGSVITTAGGNIDATAVSGNIVVGSKTSGEQSSGYDYGPSGTGPWGVSASLGGISTMAGGNVTLDAISGSINPTSGKAVSGAFGSEPGNVTLIAGDQIFGTFNVANGIGTILAGVSVDNGGQPSVLNSAANVGSSTQPVSLQLASGSWNVWAGNNIFLQEVRNPAGTFDFGDSFPFTYAPDAAVNLWAGNGITLLGQNLPRIAAASSTPGNSAMPAIYAPQLSLNAGAGGITVDSPIILDPSAAGSLHIVTRDGGDLIALNTDVSTPSGITMSDSASADWSTFALGQAATPLHLNDPNPVTLDISGSIYGLQLTVPTFAQINVVGDAYNFGFSGQNLSTAQTTSINLGPTAKANMEQLGLLNPGTDGALPVGGDLVYADTLHAATVTLTDPIPAGDLDSATLLGDLSTSVLSYNASTEQLSISGQMTAAALNDLLAPSVGLDATQRAAVLVLYADSQAANGLALAGSGNLDLTARNISLGISAGIAVDFPDAPDAALTAISPTGANINVTTSGNLDLTATTIANGGLSGGIDVSVGGTLDVGGTASALGSASAPKGIFTTSGGNVNVTAVGDVDVDGSRIAAFNGGNVDVTSQTGDVNAGTGGQGTVVLNALQLDPATGLLTSIGATIPFSGIFATTVFGSDAALGNITINAPQGSVNSSVGGVLQIAFNNADTRNNTIDVTAGQDINATGSGVIGYNVKLTAGGNINGVVVGSESVAVTSQQSVNVTAVSGGNVNISASGTVSGTVIGGGDVNVSGSAIDAAVRGGVVTTSGDIAGATLGAPAAGPAQPVQVADNANTVASKTDADNDDEWKKKKGITLAQKVGRVTVLLHAGK
ncbi:MAG: filamentous hemagglutinin N-terminal domain-containing protein [Verrucomicrobiota bacterium]